MRKTRAYRKYTPEEIRLLREAVQNGRTASQLSKLLPLRDTISIQNKLNGIRRDMRNLCMCGYPRDTDHTNCSKCREKRRRYRNERKRKGLCLRCPNPVDAGGSLTHCSRCTITQREANIKWQKTKTRSSLKKRRVSPRMRGLLRWVHCQRPWELTYLWPKFDHFVDVFGGSGRFALWAHQKGHTATYNDRDPLVVDSFLALQQGHSKEIYEISMKYSLLTIDKLLEAYQKAKENPELFSLAERAALMMTVASSTNGRINTKPGFIKMPVEQLQKTGHFIRRAKNIDTRCEDFSKIFLEYDHPNTFFMLDPPFPGTELYNHNVDDYRFDELVFYLRRLKGKFLLCVNTRRKTVEALKHFENLFIRTTRSPWAVRDIVVSNYPLRAYNLRKLDLAEFGIVK